MIQAIAGVLLAANATSLAWGLRGEWGHWWGATVPGALCGMSLWLSFGTSNNAWQMMAYGAAMAIGMSLGGVLSYGLIVGYATAETGRDQRSPLFGLMGLFLVGGLWGYFGGTALGLLMTDVKYGVGDLALWALLASVGAFAAYKLLVLGLDVHLSPPRSDAWAAMLGAAIATTVYFILCSRDATVLANAYAGWLGFGGGFSLGALIHRKGNEAGWNFSSWKFMEHSVGFFGGLALGTSAALTTNGLPEVPLVPTLDTSVLMAFLFVTYMVASNNMEHWFRETQWLTRRWFVVSQLATVAFVLLLLVALTPAAGDGEKMLGQKVIFMSLMLLYTLMGAAKFVNQWSALRSRVVATFLIQLAICLALLLLV